MTVSLRTKSLTRPGGALINIAHRREKKENKKLTRERFISVTRGGGGLPIFTMTKIKKDGRMLFWIISTSPYRENVKKTIYDRLKGIVKCSLSNEWR